MLSEQELNKIFSWLPYETNWPIDRNGKGDSIESYFRRLLYRIRNNGSFNTYQSQDGSLSNYLEFFCFPKADLYNGNAIAVYVSLCAPIACYGQTEFFRNENYTGHNFLRPDQVGVVIDDRLKIIEEEIIDILGENQLELLNKEFANRPLPEKIVDNLKNSNLNVGDRYLHGLFQCQG